MASLLRGIAVRTSRLFTTPTGLAGLGLTGGTLVYSFNSLADSKDFFYQKFITNKDPDAIVDFYSTEDFLQILGIFPFATHAILAGVVWDEKAEQTNTVWNMMRISFDITEKEEEIDGKDVVTFFNKRERFVQYIPYTKILLWDQVQNYGYRRLPDGRIEVSHQGESFYGPWPVKFLVQLHAQYVIWATEKHINSPIFGTEDLEGNEHQRSNIPLHLAKQWLADLSTNQETIVAKAKADGKGVAEAEATLKSLKRLQRRDTVITVNRVDGQKGVLSSNVRVDVEDPTARTAIKKALKHQKETLGPDAVHSSLSNLLEKSDALKRNDSKAPATA